MCCTRLAENTGRKNSPSHSVVRLYLRIKAFKVCKMFNRKKLTKQQYLLHMSSQYGELRLTITAEVGWRVCGTSANFNEFRVLVWLLHRRRSTEVNQTLHDLWPSPGLVHYIYIHFRGLLPPNGILPGAKFTLRQSLAFSYIGSITARHSSSGRQPNFAAWYLHATGRPSRWTLGDRTV